LIAQRLDRIAAIVTMDEIRLLSPGQTPTPGGELIVIRPPLAMPPLEKRTARLDAERRANPLAQSAINMTASDPEKPSTGADE